LHFVLSLSLSLAHSPQTIKATAHNKEGFFLISITITITSRLVGGLELAIDKRKPLVDHASEEGGFGDAGSPNLSH